MCTCVVKERERESMTKDDLIAAVKAGGVRWDESHWVYRAVKCRCAMCRAIRVAHEIERREHEGKSVE
jgi:hypothetical protein